MPNAEPKARWYRLTPDRFMIGLLAIEGILLLSERFRWFPFNQYKGYTVLIGLAVTGTAVLLFLLWLAVSKVFRRPMRFSLRTLLLLVLVCAVSCSWFAAKMHAAKRLHAAVEAIQQKSCVVVSDSKYDSFSSRHGWIYRPPSPQSAPQWLRDLLGDDFFNYPSEVGSFTFKAHGPTIMLSDFDDEDMQLLAKSFAPPCSKLSDDDMQLLAKFSDLSSLNLSGTPVTDAGLEHLRGLTQLTVLYLTDTQVTEQGVERLRRALPHCRIITSGTIGLSWRTKLLPDMPRRRPQ